MRRDRIDCANDFAIGDALDLAAVRRTGPDGLPDAARRTKRRNE